MARLCKCFLTKLMMMSGIDFEEKVDTHPAHVSYVSSFGS